MWVCMHVRKCVRGCICAACCCLFGSYSETAQGNSCLIVYRFKVWKDVTAALKAERNMLSHMGYSTFQISQFQVRTFRSIQACVQCVRVAALPPPRLLPSNTSLVEQFRPISRRWPVDKSPLYWRLPPAPNLFPRGRRLRAPICGPLSSTPLAPLFLQPSSHAPPILPANREPGR